jgi:hypothetical protein
MSEQAKKLLETLKKVLKSGQYIKQPRGRPRRVMKVEEAVKPSTIKRKYRTLASKVAKYSDPRLYPLLDEYKQLLYNMIQKDPIYRRSRIRQRVADYIAYRQRKPTKLERELIGDDILPSRLINRQLPAELDIDLYKEEYKDNLDIDRYSFKITQLHEDINLFRVMRQLREHIITTGNQNGPPFCNSNYSIC